MSIIPGLFLTAASARRALTKLQSKLYPISQVTHKFKSATNSGFYSIVAMWLQAYGRPPTSRRTVATQGDNNCAFNCSIFPPKRWGNVKAIFCRKNCNVRVLQSTAYTCNHLQLRTKSGDAILLKKTVWEIYFFINLDVFYFKMFFMVW